MSSVVAARSLAASSNFERTRALPIKEWSYLEYSSPYTTSFASYQVLSVPFLTSFFGNRKKRLCCTLQCPPKLRQNISRRSHLQLHVLVVPLHNLLSSRKKDPT